MTRTDAKRAPTPREREVLQAIDRLTRTRGYPPTLRELARSVGVSLTRICHYLGRLESAGLVCRQYATCRSIRLVHRCDSTDHPAG